MECAVLWGIIGRSGSYYREHQSAMPVPADDKQRPTGAESGAKNGAEAVDDDNDADDDTPQTVYHAQLCGADG